MKKYTIDTALGRLSEIAEKLESGEYDLDSSMKLYEEGVKLVSFCNKTLLNAKQRITELSEEAEGDNQDE